MKRRAFLAATAALLLAAPLIVEAQPAGRLPRVGWLGNMAPPPPPVSQLEGLRDGLRELGYIEGRNILIEYRWAEGKLDRLPMLADQMARINGVDVIIVGGLQGLEASRNAMPGVPVVLVACDPMEVIVGSLAKPGGNATGITCVSSELATKRLQFLREVVPKLSRVAVLYNPSDPGKVAEVQQLEAAAPVLGLSLLHFKVEKAERFEEAFAEMRRRRADGLITLADPLMNFQRSRIAGLAASHKIVAIYGFREYVDAGGLMSYGASLRWAYQRAAHQIDKILKGAKPDALPVEQPTTFDLIINLKAAKALGLTIPPSLLQQADQVIE